MEDSEVPDFATPEDLVGFPGAPFSSLTVSVAVAKIREACGWHVSPEVRETLTVNGDGALTQWLPTRRVVDVYSVQVLTPDGEWVDAPGWNAASGWSEHGMLYSRQPWPAGPRTIKVDLLHGYKKTPALLALVAGVTQTKIVVQESLGARSATDGDLGTIGSGPAAISAQLQRYMLGPRA